MRKKRRRLAVGAPQAEFLDLQRLRRQCTLNQIETEVEIEIISLRRFHQFPIANPTASRSPFPRKGPFSVSISRVWSRVIRVPAAAKPRELNFLHSILLLNSKAPFYKGAACRTFVKWRFWDWMISVCHWMQTPPLCLRPTPPPLTRSPDLGQSTRGRRFYVQEKRQLATGLRVLCRTRTCAMKVSHWIFARLRLPTNPVRLLFPSKEGR